MYACMYVCLYFFLVVLQVNLAVVRQETGDLRMNGGVWIAGFFWVLRPK